MKNKKQNTRKRLTWLSMTSLSLIAAALLIVASCTKETDQLVGDGQNASYKDVNIDGDNCTDIMAGQFTDAGDICLDDIDTDNDGIADALEVTYTSMDGWELLEIQYVVSKDLGGLPTTKKGNLIPGQFPYKVENLDPGTTTYTFIIAFAEIGYVCGDDSPLYAAAHCVVGLPDGSGGYTQTETGWGYGVDPEGGNWAMYFMFNISCDENPPEPPEGCETAFAFGGEYATCFIDADFDGDGSDDGFNRWGWSNGPLSVGTYTFQIYSGAGQCDISKGTNTGYLTIDYDGAQAVVTFNMYGDNTMDETHLYVGNDPLASNNGEYTVAPGQYPYKNDLGGASFDTYTIDVTGDIYVVAHAVVCGEDSPPSCDEWIVYGSNLNGGSDLLDDAIYAYDLNAETQTLVYDPTPIDASLNYPNANAYDPVNQRIYFGTDDGRLFYHEIGSDDHVQVHGGTTSGSFGTMHNASWYNGNLYYIAGNGPTVYKVTIENDVATREIIGSAPRTGGYGDIAFDPANPGRFIAVCSAGWYWYDVTDNSSGLLTHQGDGDATLRQLAYGSDGTLYAVKATSGQFYTVVYDVAAGTVTHTTSWASPYTFTDLASGPLCQ